MGPYSFSVKENYQVERRIATGFYIADIDPRSDRSLPMFIKMSYKTANENL